MGLDLVVEGCPKPGHEQEWRKFLDRYFADEELSPLEIARFQEIVIPAHERIGAPRVGRDETANQWIVEQQKAKTREEVDKTLKEFDGYYVLRLVKCDGVPRYSNGGLYDGVDETSFRGSFFHDCGNVLSEELKNEAWGHKFPEEAVAYGKALLSAADLVEKGQTRTPKKGILVKFGLKKSPKSEIPVAEQIEIVRAAGRWYIFWGERGHPIRAYF